MTPEQLHNNLFFFGSVGTALVVETVACVVAPRIAAEAAFVPMFGRQFTMGPETRAALCAPEGQASYRSAALGSIDWSRLPGPRHFTRQGARFDLDPSRSRFVVRLPFAPSWFSFGGVAVLRLSTEGAAVVVECRMTPWLSLTSAIFFGTLLAMAIADGARSIGALFVALLWIFNLVSALRSRQVFSPVLLAGICEFGERLRR